MQTAPSTAKILPVTSMRFFAALFVMLLHLQPAVAWLQHPLALGRLVRLGYISVSFFFFLSGFVLSVAYLRADKPIVLRKFFTARFARIYPLLFLCLLLDLPHFLYVQLHQQHKSVADLVPSLLVSFGALEAWFAGLPVLDIPSWSIAVEFFFYLLFPFVGPLIWRLSPKAMWPFAVGLYLFGVGSTLFVMTFHPDPYKFGYNPLTHLYEFLLGICLAKAYRAIAEHPAWRHTMLVLAPVGLLGSLIIFLMIPLFDLDVSADLLQHGVLLPLYAVVILALSSGNAAVSAMFSHRWLVVLGDASFALYLVHLPLMGLMRRVIEQSAVTGPLLFIAIAIGVSILSFMYFETPVLRWILLWLQTKPQEGTVVRNLAQ